MEKAFRGGRSRDKCAPLAGFCRCCFRGGWEGEGTGSGSGRVSVGGGEGKGGGGGRGRGLELGGVQGCDA